LGQALLQVFNALSHADLPSSVLAEERQEVCEVWQLAKHPDLGTSWATGCRNDWTCWGSTIFASEFVSRFAAIPVEVSDMAKDDAETKTAIAIRVNLVIG
jgi:hypothetical protein